MPEENATLAQQQPAPQPKTGQDADKKAPAAAQNDTDAKIDKLFAETFHSSPLANHTDLYNGVHEFKEKIKAMVAKI